MKVCRETRPRLDPTTDHGQHWAGQDHHEIWVPLHAEIPCDRHCPVESALSQNCKSGAATSTRSIQKIPPCVNALQELAVLITVSLLPFPAEPLVFEVKGDFAKLKAPWP